MPTLTINGKSVTVDPGTSVLVAAKRLGIQIPHFCWHPYLSVAGNCRMCLVEIEKTPKLAISCATPASEGMAVRTDSAKVKDAVQGVLEFLLINHPIDCPICDQAGECYLQDYYMVHGLHESRIEPEDKVAKGKALDIGPIVLDQERCVVCSRCVRYASEVSATGELYIFDRGDRSEVRTFADRPLTGDYTGNLADVCPVGALTSKEFRFKKRVWFLKPMAGICQGCATGCNIWIDQSENVVYRLRPRDNPDVNKLWLCDPGRATFREVRGGDRLAGAAVRNGTKMEATPLADALKETAARLGADPTAVGIVISARLSIEDMFVAGRLADALGVKHVACWMRPEQDDPSARADAILRSVDPHPNTHGARLVGIIPEGSTGQAESSALVDAVKSGRVRTLLLVGASDLEGTPIGDALFAELPNVPAVVTISPRTDSFRSHAAIALPMALWAERDGTFVNGQGRLQRFRRAVAAQGDACPPYLLLLALLKQLGQPLPPRVDALFDAEPPSARPVFGWLAEDNAHLAGVTYDRIGALGILLEERSAATAVAGASEATT